MDVYLSILMIRLSAYVFVHALSLKHKGSMRLFHNSLYLGTARLGKVRATLTANHPYPLMQEDQGISNGVPDRRLRVGVTSKSDTLNDI
jgi:hypothetical protein